MDLIKRQDAIDAIEKLDIPEDMCVFEILSHIELAIGTLPPAQQWIPVSERLPEESKAVLAYCPKYNNVWAVTFYNGCWHLWHPFRNDKYDEIVYGKLIAWMPLPEPWKGEKE